MGYIQIVDDALVTVVETTEYLNHASKLLTEQQRQAIVDHLAGYPKTGDLIQGGGGIRKLRWGAEGRGKRGGVRIIHFFADDRYPVFILDIFAKNDASDYSDAGLAAVRKIAKALIEAYASRRVK